MEGSGSISKNEDFKHFYIRELLLTSSGETHPISAAGILAYLEKYGIDAEHKNIYADIDALRDYGMDIMLTRGVPGGYYLATRMYELSELERLSAVLRASDTALGNETALLGKLERLASDCAAVRRAANEGG